MKKLSLLGSSALYPVAMAGIAMGLPSAALAQDVEETVEDAQASDGVIVVTGSRIGGINEFNSPDPITVIEPEVARREGKLDLASTLQSSPIAAGSTQITAAISSNFVTSGGPGAQTIDLRGLGPNRTLVLLNGRRAGPAGTRGGVSSFDLNVLPQSLAQNVQILKTGASSVYGSDAVAGVVNIITKTDTDGVELNFSSSVPLEGGGEDYRLSGIFGKTFDRGHILIAGDYSHTNELKRGDRGYLACPEAYTFREDGSRADLIDPRTGNYKCEDLPWGHVWTYNLVDNLYLPDGTNTSPNGATVLMQYQYPGETLGVPGFGTPAFGSGDFGTPAGWYPVGYDTASQAVLNSYHPFVEQQTIIPETDLYTAYADASYEISDSVELFGEFLFNRRETYQNGWRQFWNFGYTGDLYSTGAGNYWNTWGDGWQGINYISPTAITDQSDSSQKVDYYRGVAGLRGDFADNRWRYEIYGQYSRSKGKYRTQQILQDSYDIGYYQGFGLLGSCVGTVTPVGGKNCVDIPWTDPYFLAGQLTPEQIDFLFDWEEGQTTYTQKTVEASLSGELFDLPAGPLGVAFGVNAREDKINDIPGEITRSGNAWGTSTSGITAGKSLTTEAFAEINVPILADRPFFEELTLSAAGRLTNVKATRKSDGVSDSDNGNFTYKLGLNWATTDWLRFRGSYGTSFRAPALFEQFLADETFSVSQRADPCRQWGNALATGAISQRVADNCAADGVPPTHLGAGVTATGVSSGGLGQLESETSRAFVVGGVLTPQMPAGTRVSLSVDYFDIKVKGEIAQLGASNILFGCYDSENFPNDPLCSLFERGQTANADNISVVYDKFVNIATQRNTGLDFALDVRQDLGSAGTLSFTADATYQIKDDTRLLPGSPLQSDNGEAGSPKWVADFRANWNTPGNLSFFYGINLIGSTSNVSDFKDDYGGDTCIDSTIYGRYCPDLTTPTTFYHNASATATVDDAFDITLGVNNLFNTRPPRVSVLNGGQISMIGPVVAASQYSLVGRRAFINVAAKF